MKLGLFIEAERAEALERAMRRYRARQARERRKAVSVRGARRLTRTEALNMIAEKNPRSALKLLNGMGLGGRRPIPEIRGN